MRKTPRRKKSVKKRSTTGAELEGHTAVSAQPNWRFATAEQLFPAVIVREPLGEFRRLALARLPYHVAMDLVATVTASNDAGNLLIDTAVPGLRTLRAGGRVSVEESERLLRVGRLFVMLEAAFGSPLASALLATPLEGLGNRSALQCSDSIAALELAGALLVPMQQLEFIADTGNPSIDFLMPSLASGRPRRQRAREA